MRRAHPWALALALVAACAEPGTGRIVVGGGASSLCAERCVVSVVAEVVGAPETRVAGTCTDALVLSPVARGATVQVAIQGLGSDGEVVVAGTSAPFTVSSDLTIPALDVVLAPTNPPRLTGADLASPVRVLTGRRTLTLTGSGLEEGVAVTLDGAELAVLAAAADGSAVTVEVGPEGGGSAFEAARCGVVSDPLALDVEVVDVTFAQRVAPCAAGEMVGGAPDARFLDDVLMSFDCSAGEDACADATTIGHLGQSCSDSWRSLVTLDGCPLALQIGLQGKVLVQPSRTPAALRTINVTTGDMMVPGGWSLGNLGAVELLSVESYGGLTAFITRAPAPGAAGRVWLVGANGPPAPVEAFDGVDALLIDGLYVVGRVDGAVQLLEIEWGGERTAQGRRWALDRCATPVALVHGRRFVVDATPPQWQGVDRAVVLCDRADGGSVVYALTPSALDGGLRALELSDLRAGAMALSPGEQDAWLWDPAGALVAIDVTAMAELARWERPPSYPRAGMVAAPFTDELVIGGPARGEVTVVNADPGGPRCR